MPQQFPRRLHSRWHWEPLNWTLSSQASGKVAYVISPCLKQVLLLMFFIANYWLQQITANGYFKAFGYLLIKICPSNKFSWHTWEFVFIYGDFKKFLWLPQKEAARIFKAAPAFDISNYRAKKHLSYMNGFSTKKKKSLLKSDSFST